jgi:DNA modification methylase
MVPINYILRYKKESEVVLDPFVGSGSTLVACATLRRLGVGVDINPEAEKAKEKRFKLVLEKEPTLADWIKKQRFIQGDSRNLSFLPDSSIDLIVAHPPDEILHRPIFWRRSFPTHSHYESTLTSVGLADTLD